MQDKSVTTTPPSDLFQPVRLGPYHLANRIVMAPLTRSRAGVNGLATPLMVEYYAQRASAGLIVAEGTNISAQGRGYAFTPGIYSDAQVKAWRPVTEAVHSRGGRIFPQLWHVGRVSHPWLQPGGALPVAPSAIRPEATSYTLAGFEPCVAPRALQFRKKSPKPDRTVSQRCRERSRRRLRRRRNPCGQRLSHRAIPARLYQQANRCLWRVTREPRASAARSDRSRGGCMRRRTRGYPPFAVSPVNGADLDGDPAGTYGYVVERLTIWFRLHPHHRRHHARAARGPGRFRPADFEKVVQRTVYRK